MPTTLHDIIILYAPEDRDDRAASRLPRTAQGIAAAELRAAIVRGDLAPGEKILQEATAEELGVSLIPLREALKTLASEGVVTYQPQRGYYVAELPMERIRELYLARNVLEAEVERLACQSSTAMPWRSCGRRCAPSGGPWPSATPWR